MQLDDRAIQFLTAAKQAGKSKEEAFAFLQSKGYDLGSYQPQQPQAMQEQPTQKRQYTPLEKAAYTLRGAGEGIGFELGDVVGGITNTVAAPIGKTVGAITEGNPLSFSDFNPWQNFKQGRKDFVREQKQFADTHPWLNGIGEFGGAAVTGVLGAGKKLATAAGKQGLKALANQGAKEGFKWGGIYSAGAGATKDPNKISLQDALIEGPIGAGTGAVLGAALPVATVGATRGAQQFFGTKGYAKRAADKIFQKAGSKNIDDIVRTTEGTRALKEAIKADDAVAEQVRNVADKAIINGAEKTQRTVEKTLGVGDIVRARDNAKVAYNDLIKQSEAKIPQELYKNRALQEALAQAKKNDYLGEITQFGDDSLFTAQRTKENLDDMIEASFETGDFGKKVATDKTRQLMKIKDQFVKGLDQLEPAYKGIRKNFEDSTQAFNLLEELTKARGGERSNTINQILTNKNKVLISKIYGKEKADSLFNALRDQKVETDRFSKLYNAAENKLTREAPLIEGGNLLREAWETVSSFGGSLADKARLGGMKRGRRRIGEILLGMNKETKNPGFTSSIANKLKEEGGYAWKDLSKKEQKRILDVIKSEQGQIESGYNDVLNNPLKGTKTGKDDILAKLQPDDLTYFINRGAAIKDPKTGDIIVQGKALAKATGTEGNFGFSKMIFKHGITTEEAKLLPGIVRYYEPFINKNGHQQWRIPFDENNNLIAVFSKGNNGKSKEITLFKEPIRGNRKYQMSTKKDTSIPQDLVGVPLTDTNQAGGNPLNLGSEVSTNSIGKKGKKVKGVKQILNSEGNPVATTEEGTKNFGKFFKDAAKQVKTSNGEPIVFYHSTPNAGFEEFNPLSHFSPSKEYSKTYLSQGASSKGYKQTANNPDTYAVYLNMKKPFDTRDPKAREIFQKEYQAYYSPELTEKGLVDWMEVEDLAEWLQKKHPEYDGIIADEGGVGGYGQKVIDRGETFVPFKPNQIKSVKNSGKFDPKNPNIYKALIGGIGISQILRNKGEQNGIRQ